MSAGAVVLSLAHADAPSDEARFVELLNSERAAHGLAPLEVDPAMSGVARVWSTQLAATNTLRHNPAAQAENVGVGSSVEQVHAAFVASPEHESNILCACSAVGVGVAYHDTRLWVTEDFVRPSAPPPRPQPPTPAPVAPGADAPPAAPMPTAPSFTA